MSFEIMLLIVLGPIAVSALGLIIGLIKKNKIVIMISSIILLIFLARGVITYIAIINWTSF